jgi:mandelate racemase
MQPKILDIRTRMVSVPLNMPIISAVGEYRMWPYIVTEVFCEDGIIGNSYIGPYLDHSMPPIISTIRSLFENYKEKPLAPAQFFEEGMRSLSLLGRSGIALYALAALDIAFWDASAKVANQPLCVHLGGTVGKVKAYNSGGLWLNDPATLYDEACALLEKGNFKSLKMRLGRETLEADLKAISEVRRAMPDSGLLLSDFNQIFSLNEAIHRLSALDDEGLYWFEEPIKYYEFQNYAELRRRLKTPIMLGENFHGPDDAFRSLKVDNSDGIMPDLMRIGGVSGWLRTGAFSDAFQKAISSHLYPEVSAHLMRVTPLIDLLEWTDWANPLIKNPYKLEDGHIVIPDRVGAGIEFDEDAIAQYTFPGT